jgi:hypothetical protein
MKKPDPSRFTGKKNPKADELEMKGFSTPSEIADVVEEQSDKNEVGTTEETIPPSNQDTTTPRYHDTITIEEIRKAVKDFGKEAATHRFTVAEKEAIAEAIFKFKKEGVKTSENEIARIAVNFVIKEHVKNRNTSLLSMVLKALNE